jgi:hypothetical protein
VDLIKAICPFLTMQQIWDYLKVAVEEPCQALNETLEKLCSLEPLREPTISA